MHQAADAEGRKSPEMVEGCYYFSTAGKAASGLPLGSEGKKLCPGWPASCCSAAGMHQAADAGRGTRVLKWLEGATSSALQARRPRGYPPLPKGRSSAKELASWCSRWRAAPSCCSRRAAESLKPVNSAGLPALLARPRSSPQPPRGRRSSGEAEEAVVARPPTHPP